MPFTLVHAGKYRTEDKLKKYRRYRNYRNTTQKKQTTPNTTKQNYTGLVAFYQETRWTYPTTLASPHWACSHSRQTDSLLLRVDNHSKLCEEQMCTCYTNITRQRAWTDIGRDADLLGSDRTSCRTNSSLQHTIIIISLSLAPVNDTHTHTHTHTQASLRPHSHWHNKSGFLCTG